MINPVTWKSRFQLLTPEEIRTIHTASLRILDQTGLIMPLRRARQAQARDLGVRTAGDRLYFPPDVVEAALQQAPRRYTLCARNPENDLILDGDHRYLSLDGSATSLLDRASGQVRPSTKADLQDAVRVADALPQISFLWPT